MPAKSERQRRFMAKAANDAEFARRNGISQEVAREYMEAGKRRRKRQRSGQSSR